MALVGDALGRQCATALEIRERLLWVQIRGASHLSPNGAVLTGDGGKTPPCTVCHGPELKGIGIIPPLAGRYATYIVRQLYDYQHGTRAGVAALPMKEVVAKLTMDDMIAIAAYVASLGP